MIVFILPPEKKEAEKGSCFPVESSQRTPLASRKGIPAINKTSIFSETKNPNVNEQRKTKRHTRHRTVLLP